MIFSIIFSSGIRLQKNDVAQKIFKNGFCLGMKGFLIIKETAVICCNARANQNSREVTFFEKYILLLSMSGSFVRRFS